MLKESPPTPSSPVPAGTAGPATKPYCRSGNTAHLPAGALSKRGSHPSQVTVSTEYWADGFKSKEIWENRIAILESSVCNLLAERHQMRQDMEELCIAVQNVATVQVERELQKQTAFKQELSHFKEKVEDFIVKTIADMKEELSRIKNADSSSSNFHSHKSHTSLNDACCTKCPAFESLNSELQSLRQVIRGLDSEMQSSRKAVTTQIQVLSERVEAASVTCRERSPIIHSMSFASAPGQMNSSTVSKTHRPRNSSELCRMSMETKDALTITENQISARPSHKNANLNAKLVLQTEPTPIYQSKPPQMSDSTRRKSKMKKINQMSVDLRPFEKSIEEIMGYSGQKATLKLSRLTNHKAKRTSTDLNDEPVITIPASLLGRQQVTGPSPKKSTSGSSSKKLPTNITIPKTLKNKNLRQSLSYAADDPETSFSVDKEGYLVKQSGDLVLDHYGQKIKIADDSVEQLRSSVRLAKKGKPEVMDLDKGANSVKNFVSRGTPLQ